MVLIPYFHVRSYFSETGEEKTVEQNENQEPAQDEGQKFLTLDEWKALQVWNCDLILWSRRVTPDELFLTSYYGILSNRKHNQSITSGKLAKVKIRLNGKK